MGGTHIRLGKLGNCGHCRSMAVDMGRRTWNSKNDRLQRHWRVVLCRVSLSFRPLLPLAQIAHYSPDALPTPPRSTHTIHAALTRSTGPNLGTVAFSALLLTLVQLLTLLTVFLHRLPLYIPARGFFLVTGIRFAVSYLESATTALSKYALVYAGLTGDPFMPSARRARALTSGAEGRRGFSAERRYLAYCLLDVTDYCFI